MFDVLCRDIGQDAVKWTVAQAASLPYRRLPVGMRWILQLVWKISTKHVRCSVFPFPRSDLRLPPRADAFCFCKISGKIFEAAGL